MRAAGEQGARGFAEIAGPDEMIAAHIVVALAEAPRNRQAGDEASRERRRLMDAKDVGAHAIDVLAMSVPLHGAQGRLPGAPSGRHSHSGSSRMDSCSTSARDSRLPRRCGRNRPSEPRPRRLPRQARPTGRCCRRSRYRTGRPGAHDREAASIRRRRRRSRRTWRGTAGSPAIARCVPPPTAQSISCPLYSASSTPVVRPRVDEMGREQGEHAQPCLGGIFEANSRTTESLRGSAITRLTIRNCPPRCVLVSRKAGTPSSIRSTTVWQSRLTSAKKASPSVTMSPRSRTQAWSTRG